MTTAEHKVDMFNLVQQRRREGRPAWAERIDLKDVFHDETLTFPARRDAIVARIKGTRWYSNTDPDNWSGDLHNLVDELAESEDPDDFDWYWNELYDLADWSRVWIGTV